MVDIPEVTFSKDGFSESETKKIFADAGIDWPTRAERYAKLKGTIFEEIDGVVLEDECENCHETELYGDEMCPVCGREG